MLEALIEKLTEQNFAFDSKSLTDAIWLAHVMRQASDERLTAATPDENNDLRTDFTLESDPQEGPEKHESLKDHDLTTKSDERTSREGNSGSLKPVQDNPNSTRTAFLGALPALSDPAGFKHAIKPFIGQTRSVSTQLDENTTVERFIREGALILRPVLRSGSRRSLRLSLVTERVGSNSLWAQPLDELARLLGLQGTFRQLRQWSLRRGRGPDTGVGRKPEAELHEIDRHGVERRQRHSAAHMAWWQKEIVVVASDFTSDGWWDGEYPALLKRWSAEQPVLLMHTLPRRLWSRSWTGSPDAWVSTAEPLVSGRTMQVRIDINGRDAQRYDSGLALPVAALEPLAMGVWARAVMGAGVRAPALLVEARERLRDRAATDAVAAPDATYLSTAFRMASSPLARKLAQHMSVAAPLSFPVMRWIQQALLPESDSSHLAEFVLGGLLVEVAGDSSERPDEVVYDFINGVRPLLQQGMPITHGLEVQYSVGAYLEANHTEKLDLRAVVETGTDEELSLLSPELRSFALVSRQFLERIGLRPPKAVPTTSLRNETLTSAEELDSGATARGSSISGTQRITVASEVSLALEASGSSAPAKPDEGLTTQRKRDLRVRIVDLQWSSHSEEILATLTESGVDVWNPMRDRTGKRVQWSTAQISSPRRPLTVQWWIPGEGAKATQILQTVRGLVRLIADALVADASQSVRLQRVRDPMRLLDVGFDAGVLLVFETAKYGQWAEAHPEQLQALENFGKRPTVVFAAVQMHAGSTVHNNVKHRIDLGSPVVAGTTRRSAVPYGEMLGNLARLMRDDLRKMSPPSIPERRVTAISWLASGRLAIADFDGRSSSVRALDVDRARRGESIESDLISRYEGSSGLLHIFPLPAAWGTGQSTPSDPQRMDGEMGCLDADGNMAFMRGRFSDLMHPGNGLPRRPLFSTPSTMLGVTDDDLGIIIFRGDGVTRLDNVLLAPSDRREGYHDPMAALIRDRVVTGWMRDDTIFAVTASGFLHRGSVYDVFGARISNARILDSEPMRLSGSLRAAAAGADGTRFAIVTSSGHVELWDVDGDEPLASWPLRAGFPSESPRLALSASGRLIAYATGRTVYVEEAPSSSVDLSHWARHVLWVDDRPRNNEEIRLGFAKESVRCTLALSTDEALEKLRRRRFAAIISDMGRREGPSEGYVLLKALRDLGIQTPFFIFAGSNLPEHRKEAIARGGQGSTNNAQELFDQVMQVIHRVSQDSQ